jgi:hypothetical protein
MLAADARANPERSGNSAHFGTAQDGTVIQWVQLGVVAFHAFDANFHWYAVENADDGNPNNPYTGAQLSRIAQILGLIPRPEYGRFALQVTDSPDQDSAPIPSAYHRPAKCH